MLSSKPQYNVIQHSQYIPPGRHFIYFIYNRKHVFLSPAHPIVRFKGTRVFLNQVTVTQRAADELKKVTIERKEPEDDANVFNRERSVFCTYQEDTPDFLENML